MILKTDLEHLNTGFTVVLVRVFGHHFTDIAF